ncbi:single-strand selective monofunctional uracil DNA glycosylase-like [Rhynchophorus ferrugineus]|uniref:single-strand selective monofunctional uracil DNA glycosylase-like n=1 Tax=Rhynchophorus ferrugineus TaxID=354439 RepID=UPI003FCCBDE4
MNFLSSHIKYVYDPTDYASEPSEKYIEEYCQDTKQVLFVGMNPGPFGMCQTGVPFGDTEWVKNWLGIEGKIDKPLPECSARPVDGFKCTKKERSGHRFWSLQRLNKFSVKHFRPFIDHSNTFILGQELLD